MIEERPTPANERTEKGHWERDLLLGKRDGPALLVAQDRKSRYTKLRKVRNKTTAEVNKATIEVLDGEKVLSSTNDNGVEFADYEELERRLGAPIFFCHPYTSSERGTVENTNGLIRQYFPKGCDFSLITDEEVSRVEALINLRPKRVLGGKCPEEVHREKVIRMVRSETSYRKNARLRDLQGWQEDLHRMGLKLADVLLR